MNRFCSGAMVMPVTCAPKCSAAYRLSEPQPQPTSRNRIPGRPRPTLRQTSSSLSRCASSTVYVGVVRPPVPARVRHVRVEDQRVELVGEVVMVMDRLAVAATAVQPAAEHGLAVRRGRRRSEDAEVLGHTQQVRQEDRTRPHPAEAAVGGDVPHVRERGVEVALDVQLTSHVGLGRTQLARMPEDPAERLRRADGDRRCVVRSGHAAVPRGEADRQLATDDRSQGGRETSRHTAVVHDRRDIGPVQDGHAGIPSRRSTICCTSR